MPFPLFHLPYVAYINVLKSIGIPELFAMSTISKRSLRCVKAAILTQKFKMSILNNRLIMLRTGRFIHFLLDIRNMTGNMETEIWNISETKVQMRQESEYITNVFIAYCQCHQQFLVAMSQHFKKLFNITSVDITHGTEWPRALTSSLEFYRDLNLHVEEVKVIMEKTGHQFVEGFLQYFDMRRIGQLFTLPAGQTEVVNLPAPVKFQLDYVTFYWLEEADLPKIMESFMDCRTVEVADGKCTETQMIEILKNWKAGSKMKHFSIGYNGERFESIFKSLENVVPVTKVEIGGKIKQFENGKCFLVEQINGIKAVVYHEEQKIVLATKFEMDLDGVENSSSTVEAD